MGSPLKLGVFAGHSGGHLFPALAFAERAKKRFPESQIFLFTSPKAKAMIEPLAPGVFDCIDYGNEFPFSSGISLRTFRFLLELVRAFFLSSRFLSRIQPDLCVGFGSYVSFPAMKLAIWKKIPTLIHEQNKIAGKATKMLAAQADIVALSFEKTEGIQRLKPCQLTGLPVRWKLFESARRHKRQFLSVTPENPLQILIVGGSQGAHRLNEVVLQTFLGFSSEERKKIAVNHITGKKDFDWVTQQYQELGMVFKTYPFYEPMQELYAQTDVAITRSGANTLFELALFQLPSIVIPYPHAAENHQEANAAFFESKSALRFKKESEFDAPWLGAQIKEFQNSEVRLKYASAIAKMAPDDAAEKLVDLAAGLLSKEKLWELSTAI